MSQATNQDNVFITIKDLWDLIVKNWYWFLISVIVALSTAVTYIAITPPTFTRTSSVLIKSNNSKGRGGSSELESLSEFGLVKPNTDIKSEIYILKSPAVMESVVSRLNLHYNYSVKHRNIRFVDLYNTTPIIIELDSALSETAIGFEVELLSSEKIAVSNITIDGDEYDQIECNICDTIRIHYGSFIVTPTAAFSERYIGEQIYFKKGRIRDIAKEYSNGLSIEYNEEDAPILWLSYKDTNPRRAEDILNTIVSVYNENWIKERNQVTISTSKFIDERLRIIELELGGVEQDISSYKSVNLLPNIEEVSSMYLAQANTNANKQILLQNQLSMAQYIRSYMNEAASQNQLIPAQTGIESSNIENQIEKYNSLLIQKNNLLSNSSEQNPIVANMIKNLGAMKDLIVRSIDDYISTLNIQIDNIRKEEKATNKKLASNPDQAKYLLSVERQQKVKETLYLFLLQKREENELSQTFSTYNTKVINLPDGSMIPSAPQKGVILLAALIIGLLLPTIILIVIQNLDNLVRVRNDLNVLTLPFIGEIPVLNKNKRRLRLRNSTKKGNDPRVKIVVAAQNRNIINEAFRNVRNNIDFMRPKSDGGTVIMTISLFPGSGKTFTLSNIAFSMALKGARTVILDVDLRKATLSQLVDSPKVGLSDYLASKIDSIEPVIINSKLNPNLDVIPAGKIPPNPSELILGDRFGELITSLRSKYDYIFLDCPPVGVVSETAIIGTVCDMTLFVIRAGVLDKRMLPEIDKIYKSGQYRNMGIILNDVAYGTGRYGYGGYGYGNYGYGDGSEQEESITTSL